MANENIRQPKAWVISVNMGYGHQRTAFPLRYLAPQEKVINANDYEGIPKEDRAVWEGTRKLYEFISNFKKIFLIGDFAFAIFNRFQKIINFYPKKEFSEPNFQLRQMFYLIKRGWGRHLIEQLANNQVYLINKSKKPLPLVTTFFTPAFMAEAFNYPGDIYCVICDVDIARPWAPFNPEKSRIKYFAPTERVVERLKLYGVREGKIFLTGFPLPLENITNNPEKGESDILKHDLSHRILNLDPNCHYRKQYEPLIKKYVGNLPNHSNHPLTILFSIGGAGAQKEIGIKILKSLIKKIKNEEIKIILAIGTKEKVREYFNDNIKKLGLKNKLEKSIELVLADNINDYFNNFNLALRKTDIFWTKPSELSFYAALGLPVIIAPTIGSQEEFNKRWLLKSGFGILQEDPNCTHQWLFDWLEKGYLAEAAMQGFIEGEKLGTYHIEQIISR